MAVSINSIAIPAYNGLMNDRGQYRYTPPEAIGEDGEGLPIYAGYGSAEWRFDYLTEQEWTWWQTTLLGGSRSAKFGAAVLWDDNNDETAFTRIIVHRPEAGPPLAGEFRDVVIRFTGME